MHPPGEPQLDALDPPTRRRLEQAKRIGGVGANEPAWVAFAHACLLAQIGDKKTAELLGVSETKLLQMLAQRRTQRRVEWSSWVKAACERGVRRADARPKSPRLVIPRRGCARARSQLRARRPGARRSTSSASRGDPSDSDGPGGAGEPEHVAPLGVVA
jgi:DNA-binding transcriptional regulator YdaS (Cro superfamily)